jgi:hypothetical protein
MRNAIIILSLLLSGCSATWHIQKAVQKKPNILKTDTIVKNITTKRDTTILLDTNITVLLPRDTVRIERILSKYVTLDPIKEKNGIITVEACINNGKLNILSYLDSTMIYRYKDSLLIKDAIISNLREITVEQGVIIEEKELLIDRLKNNALRLKYIIMIVIILIILGLGFKFYRWINK